MSQQKYFLDYANISQKARLGNSLANELSSYSEKGVSLSIKGRSARPQDIALACALCEGKAPYMRDYITDENGIVKMIDFNRID